MEKVTIDMVEIARELEVNSGDVTALLQSQDQTLMDEELLPMDEQSKWFFEKESPGFNNEDC